VKILKRINVLTSL